MSLQSRLATLISAIGADIKEARTFRQQQLAIPQLFMRGGITHPVAAGNNIAWITSEQDVAIQPAVDTNRMPISRDCDPAEFDLITGYKPQMRLRTVIGTNGTDPGTQTFTCGVTGLVTIPGAGGSAGGSGNRRWTTAGTFVSTQRTNLAAATRYEDESAWTDLTSAALAAASVTTTRVGVYLFSTATVATGAMVSCEWEVELRWVPE